MNSPDNASNSLRPYFSNLRHRQPNGENNVPLQNTLPPQNNPLPTPSPFPQPPPSPVIAPESPPNPPPPASISPPFTPTPLTTNVVPGITIFTTTYPVATIFQDTMTFTSYAESIVISTLTSSASISMNTPPTSSTPQITNTLSSIALSETASPNNEAPINDATISNTVCVGHGLDAASEGVLAAIVLSGVIGLTIWVSSLVLRDLDLIEYISTASICYCSTPLSPDLWPTRVVCST